MKRLTKARAIKKAYQHYAQYYEMPKCYTSVYNIQWLYRCYCSCGALEVLKIIENVDNIGFILDDLQSFIEDCLDASTVTKGDTSWMFATYADVATDFIDLFL